MISSFSTCTELWSSGSTGKWRIVRGVFIFCKEYKPFDLRDHCLTNLHPQQCLFIIPNSHHYNILPRSCPSHPNHSRCHQLVRTDASSCLQTAEPVYGYDSWAGSVVWNWHCLSLTLLSPSCRAPLVGRYVQLLVVQPTLSELKRQSYIYIVHVNVLLTSNFCQLLDDPDISKIDKQWVYCIYGCTQSTLLAQERSQHWKPGILLEQGCHEIPWSNSMTSHSCASHIKFGHFSPWAKTTDICNLSDNL